MGYATFGKPEMNERDIRRLKSCRSWWKRGRSTTNWSRHSIERLQWIVKVMRYFGVGKKSLVQLTCQVSAAHLLLQHNYLIIIIVLVDLLIFLQRGTPVVVGITSFGVADCHPDYPSIYTKVGDFKRWIMAVMRQHTTRRAKKYYNFAPVISDLRGRRTIF